MSRPYFFSQPFRYMRWAAHERPAIFFSIVLGCLGPVSLVSIPPVRRYFGDVNPEKVPMTYPSTSTSTLPVSFFGRFFWFQTQHKIAYYSRP